MLYDDIDVENLTWQLFERSGDISYYLLYSKLKEDKLKEEKQRRR